MRDAPGPDRCQSQSPGRSGQPALGNQQARQLSSSAGPWSRNGSHQSRNIHPGKREDCRCHDPLKKIYYILVLKELYGIILALKNPKYLKHKQSTAMGEYEDTFALAWGDFASNAAQSFAELRKDSEFSDVTLACDDDTMIRAHKVVLASCSPVFRKLFQQYNHSNPLIILRGLKKTQLDNIIDYAYFGQIDVDCTDLEAYLKIAEEFKLKGLSDFGNLGDDIHQVGKVTSDQINETKGQFHEQHNGSCHEKEVDSIKFEIRELSNTNDSKDEHKWKNLDVTSIAKSVKKMNIENNDMEASIAPNEKEIVPPKSESFRLFQDLINSKIVKLCDSNSINDYKCSDCDKEFSSKNRTSLKNHIEAYHIAPFQDIKLECSLCQKIFCRSKPYIYHSKVCANQINNAD